MFLFVKTVKYWVYFLDFSVKNHEGVVGELRNSNHIWFMSCTEKHQKITKFSGHPFIVNFTFEIYKYFSLVTWSLLRYLELKLLVTIQLVPDSLADSLISKCNGSRVWLMVQVLKESETDQLWFSNISYLKQLIYKKMGAEVIIFCKILNSKFLKGLRHSALLHINSWESEIFHEKRKKE